MKYCYDVIFMKKNLETPHEKNALKFSGKFLLQTT